MCSTSVPVPLALLYRIQGSCRTLEELCKTGLQNRYELSSEQDLYKLSLIVTCKVSRFCRSSGAGKEADQQVTCIFWVEMML